MKIAGRDIGPDFAPYVIAELGVNHDGSTDKAAALVEAAAAAGADAVKFQLFDARLLMSRASVLAAYQRAAGERDPIEMLRGLQLSPEQLRPLVRRAKELRVHAIVTVFSVQLVAPAAVIGWDAFKTASPDVIHRPLLTALADTGLPMILSTGAAKLGEVARAVTWLQRAADRLALLQCVSSYPTQEHDAALRGIVTLRRVHSGPVGYSDHTTAIDTGALAVAAGAVLLEKHLTLDRTAKGPDHAASLEPSQLAEYVRLARRAWTMCGRFEKIVQDCERDVREVSRQSVVSARSIRKGDRLGANDLVCKRPGSGIEPWRMQELFGKLAARDIPPDVPLVAEDIDGWSPGGAATDATMAGAAGPPTANPAPGANAAAPTREDRPRRRPDRGRRGRG